MNSNKFNDFAVGFVKAAMNRGYSQEESLVLFKEAAGLIPPQVGEYLARMGSAGMDHMRNLGQGFKGIWNEGPRFANPMDDLASANHAGNMASISSGSADYAKRQLMAEQDLAARGPLRQDAADRMNTTRQYQDQVTGHNNDANRAMATWTGTAGLGMAGAGLASHMMGASPEQSQQPPQQDPTMQQNKMGSFLEGFVKAANDRGYTRNQCIDLLLKSAADGPDQSSWAGRTGAMQNLDESVHANHPFSGLWHGKETNDKNIDQAADDSAGSYGSNATRFAGAGAQVGGLAGGGLGASYGGLLGHASAPYSASGKQKMIQALLGALAGGTVGGAGGAALGAGGGALEGIGHKHRYNQSNYPSRVDAKERFKEHPLATHLSPLGYQSASM